MSDARQLRSSSSRHPHAPPPTLAPLQSVLLAAGDALDITRGGGSGPRVAPRLFAKLRSAVVGRQLPFLLAFTPEGYTSATCSNCRSGPEFLRYVAYPRTEAGTEVLRLLFCTSCQTLFHRVRRSLAHRSR